MQNVLEHQQHDGGRETVLAVRQNNQRNADGANVGEHHARQQRLPAYARKLDERVDQQATDDDERTDAAANNTAVCGLNALPDSEVKISNGSAMWTNSLFAPPRWGLTLRL